MYTYCFVHVIQNIHAALITDVIEYELTGHRRTPTKNNTKVKTKIYILGITIA